MCGIAGIVSLASVRPTRGSATTGDAPRVDPDDLHAMAAQLVHRGPDDEGYYLDPQRRCGFGFRRLSIIDLETGQQPISNADRSVHVVFNGEIYNFRELREELVQRGYQFRTRGDAEVIVHAYVEWGEQCFEHLHGMFAIAIWDQPRGQLLLARDRFGKKPLHYALLNNRLYFASELKAILAAKGITREIDPQSLHRYLLFQYVPAPHAIYRHFRKLPPGCYLHVDEGEAHTPHPYYWPTPPQAQTFEGTYEDAKHRLGELLTAAVAKRLIADVPLGAFLSGGIDSSLVVGLMRRLGVSPLRTFSIGFPDARYDETAYARRVAAHFSTEHHEHTVTPQAREVLETLAWHYDEPFADSSAIPTYYLSRWTRESVTVALTGDAGDECFAGYDRYRAAQLAAHLALLPRPARAALSRLAGWLPHGRPKTLGRRLYRFLDALAHSPSRRYLSWINIFSPELLATGYQPEFLATIDFDEPLRWFDGLYDQATGQPANRAVHCDLQSYLPYDLLTKVDTASMACGLECRSPLLDHELVEFALSLPLSWRLGRGGGKRILKDWAAELLPAEILHRPKMGFGVPVGEWFRRELRDLLEDCVLSDDSLCARVFRADWRRSLVNDHLSGRANHEHPLWALLMLELWQRRWQPTGG